LPWALRLPVAREQALLNAVSRVCFEEVRAWLREAGGSVPGARVEAAAVTFVPRFGGSLNPHLHLHLHLLVADGVFAWREDESAPEFTATSTPTRDELRRVIAQVIGRLETIAARRARRADGAGGEAGHDGMAGLRRAAGARGTFARVDEKGAHDGDDERTAASSGVVARGWRPTIAMRWRGCAGTWCGPDDDHRSADRAGRHRQGAGTSRAVDRWCHGWGERATGRETVGDGRGVDTVGGCETVKAAVRPKGARAA
jgi:hypothetical protein